MEKLVIKSGWLLPVDSPPIKNGAITIKGERISYVGKANKLRLDSENRLGGENIILLPGLVNAHTHLEFTAMKGKIGKGIPFKEWIEGVIAYRECMSKTNIKTSIEDGAKMLLHNGTTAVGDFSSTGISGEILGNIGMRGRIFHELVSFKEKNAREVWATTKEKLDKEEKNKNIKKGIGPHAPYSVSSSLLRKSHKHAIENNIPISLHIAETEDEEIFIREGKGSIRELLIKMGKWDNSWHIPHTSPVKYLSRLGTLNKVTGIHLNLIDEKDIEILGKEAVSVVCCPGSNRWFEREKRCPVPKLLEGGINVALGTDGLSSNSVLNILDEMRIVKEEFPSIRDEKILEMGTINGAKALGLDDIGLIKEGFKADLVGIRANNPELSPYQFLSDTDYNVEFVIIGGKLVYKKR